MKYALGALLLIVAVHLGTGLAGWTGVGLVADDRFAVGLHVMNAANHVPFGTVVHDLFFRQVDPASPQLLYRPFVDLLYAIEFRWFGVDPVGYHAVNSACHCLTAWVWFVLLRRWTGRPFAGLAAALLFVGWPGHSEATHWISARTNVLSTTCTALALLLWDGGWRAAAGAGRWARCAAAIAVAVIAVGCKESAVVVVPMAWLVGCVRRRPGASIVGTAWGAALGAVPLGLAIVAWLAWRAHVLHTWGVGPQNPWQLDVRSPAAWAAALGRWGALLMAPVHEWAWPGFRWLLWPVHGVLLAVAATGFARRELRPALGFAAFALGLVFVAIAGLHVDPETLENVRYSYELAVPFALLLGLGAAALPPRAAWSLLAAVVLVHGFLLDANRAVWLRAGAVYARLEREVQAAAASGPVRVFDAPGRYDGAFVYLIENSPLLLWWPPQPIGALQGRISSADEWQPALAELAAAAAAHASLPARPFVVAWDDGSLLPLPLDPQWPAAFADGGRIECARLGRQRPFAGGEVPVQVQLRAAGPVVLVAEAASGERRWRSAELAVAPVPEGAPPAVVAVPLPVPGDLPAGAPVTVELVLRSASGERRWPLGGTTVGARGPALLR